MLHDRPILARYVGHSFVAVLFLVFLMQAPAPANARPFNADRHGNSATALHKALTPAIKLATTSKVRFVNAQVSEQLLRASSNGFSLNWIRIAIKSLLINVWASIHAYANGNSSSGGHCS